MPQAPLRVFVGWDKHESDAFEVCRFSLLRRTSIPTEVIPIKLEEMRRCGLYWRDVDPLASTEFTYSRFLTPALADYAGTAVFCDCDFLWLADIAGLMTLVDGRKAVSCVQHDYRPSEPLKMDGRAQAQYPRKNWSSLMIFNCAHPSVRALTPAVINAATGAFLHRMQWVADEDIGALPIEWNWLEGWSGHVSDAKPKAVHFTRGGPWFPQWQHADYADEWRTEHAEMKASQDGRPHSASR
jgi:hypothetical protein